MSEKTQDVNVEIIPSSQKQWLTHGADGVCCGPLTVRKPQGCQLGGGENDEGLSQGTEGLAQHHDHVPGFMHIVLWSADEAQRSSKHVQPGAEDQLQGEGGKAAVKSLLKNNNLVVF